MIAAGECEIPTRTQHSHRHDGGHCQRPSAFLPRGARWVRPTNRNESAASLRDRLARLSRASLRINETLDLETALQGVMDSACSLVDARYGVIALLDSAGRLRSLVTSGLAGEEGRRLEERCPSSSRFFEHMGGIKAEPVRIGDVHLHAAELDLHDLRLPTAEPGPPLGLPGRANSLLWGAGWRYLHGRVGESQVLGG